MRPSRVSGWDVGLVKFARFRATGGLGLVGLLKRALAQGGDDATRLTTTAKYRMTGKKSLIIHGEGDAVIPAANRSPAPTSHHIHTHFDLPPAVSVYDDELLPVPGVSCLKSHVGVQVLTHSLLFAWQPLPAQCTRGGLFSAGVFTMRPQPPGGMPHRVCARYRQVCAQRGAQLQVMS
jgi:hypothetical protein